jgi:hypothetical protein
MKESLKKEFTRRLRMVLLSELNDRTKTTELGTLAVPILQYNFIIIYWKL